MDSDADRAGAERFPCLRHRAALRSLLAARTCARSFCALSLLLNLPTRSVDSRLDSPDAKNRTGRRCCYPDGERHGRADHQRCEGAVSELSSLFRVAAGCRCCCRRCLLSLEMFPFCLPACHLLFCPFVVVVPVPARAAAGVSRKAWLPRARSHDACRGMAPLRRPHPMTAPD